VGCLPYFKFYAGDWLVSVLGLTLEEQGAYIRLIAWSWENGPVPLEKAGRARLLGVTPKKLDTLWKGLGRHWERTEDGYFNPRLERERVAVREAHERRVAAGRHGGLAKAAAGSNGA
jgi:uncharacterized protein YdaU (DUF1376 family)